jgi:hypothetical protein
VATAEHIIVWFSARGYGVYPDPRQWPSDLSEWRQRRARPRPEKRSMTPAVRRIVEESIQRVAESRGASCLAVRAGPTGAAAVLECSQGIYRIAFTEFAQAVKQVASRRAFREAGWPRGESVLTRTMGWAQITEEEIAGAASAVERCASW